MTSDNLNEILKFAIENEVEAAKFYGQLSEKVKHHDSKVLLKELEKMELGHADILKNLDLHNIEKYKKPKVNDLKLSDYMIDPVEHENMTFQDVLVIAMKKEKAADKLYSDLAEQAENTDIKNLFLKLAAEESKHKLQLESIYDEVINYEN